MCELNLGYEEKLPNVIKTEDLTQKILLTNVNGTVKATNT